MKSQLRADAIAFSKRQDITPVFDVLLRLAESDIATSVRSTDMERRIDGALSGPNLVLPARLLEIVDLQVSGKSLSMVGELEFLDQKRRGCPSLSYVQAGNIATILGGVTQPYSLRYIEAHAPMVGESDTTSLYAEQPGLYLHAVLKQIAVWALDRESEAAHSQTFTSMAAQHNARQNQKRLGRMRMNIRGVV